MTFHLGQRVTITHQLHRMWEERPDKRESQWGTSQWKVWKEFPLGEPATGIVIGQRTYSNGENRNLYHDEPIVFLPREHFTVILVVTNMHQNPIACLPEHVAPEHSIATDSSYSITWEHKPPTQLELDTTQPQRKEPS